MSYQRSEIIDRICQSTDDEWYKLEHTDDALDLDGGYELVYEQDVRLRLQFSDTDLVREGEQYTFLPTDHPPLSVQSVQINFDTHLVSSWKIVTAQFNDQPWVLFVEPSVGISEFDFQLSQKELRMSVALDELVRDGCLTEELLMENFGVVIV